MGELEELNENDTGSEELTLSPPPKPPGAPPSRGRGSRVNPLWHVQRVFWLGARLCCDLSYAVFGLASLGGVYLFLEQLYRYVTEGNWSDGSLLATISRWVPARHLAGWFPPRADDPIGEWVHAFLSYVPASVFLVVTGLFVLLTLNRFRWQFVVWEQQALVRIAQARKG